MDNKLLRRLARDSEREELRRAIVSPDSQYRVEYCTARATRKCFMRWMTYGAVLIDSNTTAHLAAHWFVRLQKMHDAL